MAAMTMMVATMTITHTHWQQQPQFGQQAMYQQQQQIVAVIKECWRRQRLPTLGAVNYESPHPQPHHRLHSGTINTLYNMLSLSTCWPPLR